MHWHTKEAYVATLPIRHKYHLPKPGHLVEHRLAVYPTPTGMFRCEVDSLTAQGMPSLPVTLGDFSTSRKAMDEGQKWLAQWLQDNPDWVQVLAMPGAKGNGGEKEVARLIQPWWQRIQGEKESLFIRTPGSGGWRGGAAKEAYEAHGDLMTTSLTFPFTVEVKRREEWTLASLLKPIPLSPVWDWWVQCQRDAAKSARRSIPMLWVRRNREPWYVFLPSDLIVPVLSPVEGSEICAPEQSLMQLIRPLHTWTRFQLCAVNHGAIEPALYEAKKLLGLDPALAKTLKRQPGLSCHE